MIRQGELMSLGEVGRSYSQPRSFNALKNNISSTGFNPSYIKVGHSRKSKKAVCT